MKSLISNYSDAVLRASLALAALAISTVLFGTLFGQAPVDTLTGGKAVDATTYTDVNTFSSGVEWIYGFLVIVTGYLSTYIPFFKNINKGVYRVLAVAVVLGAGFYFGAGVNLINLFITYTVSTSFYEVILKLLRKEKVEDTPTPAS